MAAAAVLLMHREGLHMALFVVLLFYGYLRPGEARSLRCQDLRRPAGGPQESLNFFSVVIAPEERVEWSKTQTFDDTVA
eukprot:9609136-Lingulodinium_polyedra.AAC.1